MRYLLRDSISPTYTFSASPDVCEVTSNSIAMAITVDDVKDYALIYDNESDTAIENQIKATQSKIERFVNRDSTVRNRVALWALPQEIIEIPYGVHSNIVVYQRLSEADDWELKTEDIDYYVIDSATKYKSIRLKQLTQTKITYTSGSATIDPEMKQAIIQEVTFFFKNRNDPDARVAETRNGISLATYNLLTGYIRY